MSKKYYKLYCEYCNWKKTSDGTDLDNLHKLKQSSIQRSVPRYNKEKKEIVEKDWIKLPKKFRCPKCGRPIVPKQITNPQEKIEQYHRDKFAEQERQEWEAIEAEARRRYDLARQEYEQEQNQLDGNQESTS